MTLRLSCHHGHQWEISDDLSGEELVCRLCGSVTSVKLPREAHMGGPVDATIDTNQAAGKDPSVMAKQDADSSKCPPAEEAEASIFVTLDFTPAAKGKNSSELSSNERRLTGISRQPNPTEHFTPPKLEGYEVLEELGRGGMGVVYRARDKTFGREVALKTLQHMNAENLHRFKGEFRTLADISHPNLAALYELLSDGETWCFSMEILEGVEFLEYIWSGFESLESRGKKRSFSISSAGDSRLTSERMERLEDAMKQLAIGLNSLHEAGVLHSDIKPSNVFMTTEKRLVLLDFGLSTPIARIKRDSKIVQGTPRYMSPEQASASRLTKASDWYAVGVMLYEVLTGQLPFRGKTLEILSQKQNDSPINPAQLRPDNPQHLNKLCVALLDRLPKTRPSAHDVLRCFGAPELADEVLSSKRAVAKKSVELVGRAKHYELLRQSFSRVVGGETLSTFVHGKSGMGKSVLIRSFLDRVNTRNEAVVLEGRCYEQESVPFKALDSLIDSLAVHLESLPDEVIHSVMPRDRLALTRVFPVLRATPEVENATYPSIENADQPELRQRAMSALRELLQRLAIRDPLILYVDDLQWGDVDSAGLLADLVRPPGAPRMLLLVSYRNEDIENSACLKAVTEAFEKGEQPPPREELAIEALTEDEATKLALMLLGKDDETHLAFAQKISQESRGSPFFVWELAQHVQDDPGIADQALELDEVIWKRVTRLPMETRQLLELVAVTGRPIPAGEAFQVLSFVEKGQAYLAQLRTTNFVRITATEDDGAMVETYHDRVRESVVKHLDEPTIKGLSCSLALTIEKVSGIQVDDLRAHLAHTPDYEEPQVPFELAQHKWQRVFDLAYFYDAAGEHERAFPFALVAAERAQKQNALEVAQQQYGIALRGCKATSAAMQLRVHEGLGDILMLRGHYDEAEVQFDGARALAKGDTAIARVDGKLGELSFKRGDQSTATAHLERALTVLGHKPPTSNIGVLAGLAKESLTQVLHSMLPALFTARRELHGARARTDLLTAHLYGRLSYAYWFSRSLNATVWAHLRQLNLAERFPPTLELGQAYSLHAPIMSALAYYSRGIDYSERSLKIRKEQQDRWGQGQTLHFHGVVLFAASEFEESIEKCSEAIQFLEGAGDFWESCSARYHKADSLYHLGDLRQAVREAKAMYHQAVEVGDASASAYVLQPWVTATLGRIPIEIFEAEFARPRADPLATVQLIQSRGIQALLGEDDPEQAVELIQKSIEAANKRGLQNTYVMSNYAWLTTSLRVLAQRAAPGSPEQKDRLRSAKKTVRKAIKVSRKFQNNLAHALRESAILETLAGREAEARKLFAASLATAEHRRMNYEHAKTSLAQADAGVTFGWPDAIEHVALCRSKLKSIEEFSE